MTLEPPKQLFAPYVLGSSLIDSFSFSPFTVYQTKGKSGNRFIARFEENRSSPIATEISSTYVEALADVNIPFQGLTAFSATRDMSQDYFILESNGRSNATICSQLELLQTLIISCAHAEGVTVKIWARVGSEVFGEKIHIHQGTTLLNTARDHLLPLGVNLPTNSELRLFFTLESSAVLPHLLYIKPVRLLESSPGNLSTYSFSSIPFGERFHQESSIFELYCDAFNELKVSRLTHQPYELRDAEILSHYDQLLGNKLTPNPVHLASMLSCQVSELRSLPTLAASSARCPLGHISEDLPNKKLVNYLVVMTPRSGSTALSEKLARLGIGCPTELTTGFFYNLLSHLEAKDRTIAYTKYVLDLLRDRNSQISGIQIDPDRLSHTWDHTLSAVIDKYIYFFRRSISKQAMSMSLAVHHNLWFAYDPIKYNDALEKLTIDEYKGQFARIVRMNLNCLGHFLLNRECSIILTNEQHLRNFDDYVPLIQGHLGNSSVTEDDGLALNAIKDALPQPPTQVVSGRDAKFSGEKLARFLDELEINDLDDAMTLAGVPQPNEVVSLYRQIFTI